jgi:hypothetical protein
MTRERRAIEWLTDAIDILIQEHWTQEHRNHGDEAIRIAGNFIRLAVGKFETVSTHMKLG